MPRATVMMPTFYVRLLQDPRLTREATRHMRLFVAGSRCSPRPTANGRPRRGHAILERYGMTETNMLTSNPYEGRACRPVGHPLPGVELRITDPETGAAAARRNRHDRGEGPQRVQRLLAHAGEDQGRVPPRRLLHHSARSARTATSTSSAAARTVITGGYNVYPKEVETEIDALDGIVESAVIGVPHPDFGEGVTAVVVKQEGAALDERAVTSALDARLANTSSQARPVRRPFAAQCHGQGPEERAESDTVTSTP